MTADGGERAVRPGVTTPVATRLVELIHESGLPAGAHVTEQWAAGPLGVSRTPVRKAMALLAELGILRQEPHRGYFLARPAESLARAGLAGEAAPEDDAYFRLADDHLGGRLTGPFTTADVARRYGLTPRQAGRLLTRMAGEDLISGRTGRGWEFRPVLATAEAHDQSYRFRMIIEPAALLEPGFTPDADAFARHRARQEALLTGDALLLPRAELFQVNAEFHEMLVGCANNPFLADALRRQNRQRRLIEYRHQLDRTRLVGQAREHLRLLDLVESGRRRAAADFLRDHLDAVRARKTGIAGGDAAD
ncbi:GntR family transcriptional regulator [Streptomyces mayteni]